MEYVAFETNFVSWTSSLTVVKQTEKIIKKSDLKASSLPLEMLIIDSDVGCPYLSSTAEF